MSSSPIESGISMPKIRNPSGGHFNSIRSQWERRATGNLSQQPCSTATIKMTRARLNDIDIVAKLRETVRPKVTSREATPEDISQPRGEKERFQTGQRQIYAPGETARTQDSRIGQETSKQAEKREARQLSAGDSKQRPVHDISGGESNIMRRLKAAAEQDASEARAQLLDERRHNKVAQGVLRCQNIATLAAKQQEFDALLIMLRKEHSDALAAQQRIFDATLAVKNKELGNAMASHREELNKKLADQQWKHEIALAAARNDHAEVLEAKQREFEAEIHAKTTKFDKELGATEQKRQDAIFTGLHNKVAASKYKRLYENSDRDAKRLSDGVRDLTLRVHECMITIRRLRSVCGNVVTRRTILMARMAAVSDGMVFESGVAAKNADKREQGRHASRKRERSMARYRAARRTTAQVDPVGLDDILDIGEAAAYALNLDGVAGRNTALCLRSHKLKICDCCGNYKFVNGFAGAAPGGARSGQDNLGEFADLPNGVMDCGCAICKSCLRRWVAVSTDEYACEDYVWALDDGATMARCPNPECSRRLDGDDVLGLLNASGVRRDDVEKITANFFRAKAVRTAIRRVSVLAMPNSAVSLAAGYDLYLTLREHGVMSSLLDIPLAPAFSPPGDNGIIKLIDFTMPNPLDITDSTLITIQVPLLLVCLHRKSEPRTCVVCFDDFHDIDSGPGGDEACWDRICVATGFQGGGSWISELGPFPSRFTLRYCEHDLDICRNCLKASIAAQLDAGGRQAVERISCPSVGCERLFGYEEVGKLASGETFAEYDRYLLLTFLSNEANFTWCLRPGCSSGQIVENHDRNPRTQCTECKFDICFRHQIAWHEGLSCAQYDSAREHGGDPEYEGTMRWIQENSKACPGPGCGVRIQKGEACFHMTCSKCRFEFCWVCLANWMLIHPREGPHNRNAHAEGCYFRTSQLQPTALSGRTIEEALGRGR